MMSTAVPPWISPVAFECTRIRVWGGTRVLLSLCPLLIAALLLDLPMELLTQAAVRSRLHRSFQNVQSLAIFIPGNQDDEETTKVSKIAILGETIQHTGLKRSEAEQKASSSADWLGSGIKEAK